MRTITIKVLSKDVQLKSSQKSINSGPKEKLPSMYLSFKFTTKKSMIY